MPWSAVLLMLKLSLQDFQGDVHCKHGCKRMQRVLQAEVTAFAEECERDLAAAEPIIKDAEAALNSLDKGSLGELKSFGSPAAEVVQVVSACIVLTAPGGKIPKVPLLHSTHGLCCTFVLAKQLCQDVVPSLCSAVAGIMQWVLVQHASIP